MKTVQLMLCHNDDNGAPTGRLSALDLCVGGASCLLYVECVYDRAETSLRFDRVLKSFRVGRRAFWFEDCRENVANIYWCAVSVSFQTAADVVSYVLAQKRGDVSKYAVTGGVVPLADVAESRRLTADDIARAIGA